jgi:hypothetical protein
MRTRNAVSSRHGLPAYFRHRISTGPLEGLNKKIEVRKCQAYGFRDMLRFKLRICFFTKQPLHFPDEPEINGAAGS